MTKMEQSGISQDCGFTGWSKWTKQLSATGRGWSFPLPPARNIPTGYMKPVWAYFVILCEVLYFTETAEN